MGTAPKFVLEKQRPNYDHVRLADLADPKKFTHRLVGMKLFERTVTVEFTSIETDGKTERDILAEKTPYFQDFLCELRESRRGEKAAEAMFGDTPKEKREKRGGSELLTPEEMKAREAINKARRDDLRNKRRDKSKPKPEAKKEESKDKQKDGKKNDRKKK